MACLYCNSDLKDILFLMEEDEILYKMLDGFYDLVLNITDDEIFELIKENPIANYFFKRDSGSLLSDIDAFRKLDNKDYIDFSNDIIICEEDINTEEIRDKYGVLALQIDEQFLEYQNYNFGYTIESNKECKFKSWNDVVEPKPFTPVNTAVVVDNFLWSKKDCDFHNDNSENLYAILSKIIPKNLEIPFQVLLNIDNRNTGINKAEAQEKLKKVKNNLEKITGKTVEVGISSHTDPKLFHSRVILTNYQYFHSDRGFTIFKDGRIKASTYGTRNWVYYGIDNYVGEINKHHHQNLIRNLKTSTSFNERTETDAIYNIGTWKNRLLN